MEAPDEKKQSWSEFFAEVAEANHNPFHHPFYGMLSGMATLFDGTIQNDIHLKAKRARMKIEEDLNTSDDAVTQAGAKLAQGLTFVGEIFAEYGLDRATFGGSWIGPHVSTTITPVHGAKAEKNNKKSNTQTSAEEIAKHSQTNHFPKKSRTEVAEMVGDVRRNYDNKYESPGGETIYRKGKVILIEDPSFGPAGGGTIFETKKSLKYYQKWVKDNPGGM